MGVWLPTCPHPPRPQAPQAAPARPGTPLLAHSLWAGMQAHTSRRSQERGLRQTQSLRSRSDVASQQVLETPWLQLPTRVCRHVHTGLLGPLGHTASEAHSPAVGRGLLPPGQPRLEMSRGSHEDQEKH